MLRSLLIVDIKLQISIVLRVSRSPVGSSSSSSFGLLASARAIVTRCCSPPDSSLGRWFIRSCSPTALSRFITRDSRSLLLSFPAIVIGSSTFSYALIVASRLKVWKTNPIDSRRSVASSFSLESARTSLPNSR
eukprot:comp21314_c0_seq1/m.45760 comp21314_c0_seq1/g.45760  ORF comp21314_c0_seq1/g.45760 comp21314_c0_seq1/m.45760 type:complete len:134 (+) comp21314_c0_seq1:930-1331(+)